MIDDIVINSYKEQIKESIFKTQAVKVAGFDIVVEELQKRGVDISKILAFFNKIKDANTKEEINNLTIDELNNIIDDINIQVTKSLISPVEIAGILERRSKMIAMEKSPNGKITDNDNYVKVGSNLASEINKHGISYGLSICIKNYCIQKMYQADYKEKISEREKKLGIYKNNEKGEHINNIKKVEDKKNNLMIEIFSKEVANNNIKSFDDIKNDYFTYLNNLVSKLNEYK